ncbi:MAG: sigma-70 family RNA polymerase sigma factor [Thermoanaerobaculia bacterium]|nr:sigma-70 family RNA polymerase sigma factor [Thermoanaerobaculia bacterium]
MSSLTLSLRGDETFAGDDRAAEESDLVRRFLDGGDPQLFAALVRPYEEPLTRLVAATLGPRLRNEVEDCVQDILVHVFHKLSYFRLESRFSTWLYRVARNKAIDLHRRPRFKRPHVDDARLDLQPASTPDPHADAASREERQRLRSEVERLSEPQRSIVHLFYWMETPVDDIAVLLGIKPATVKSHLFRARKRLGRALAATR